MITTPLKHVATMNGRIGWQNLRSDEFTDSGPYLVTGMHFNDYGGIDWGQCFHITHERWLMAPEIQLRPGDILVTKDGSIGKVAFVDKLPGLAALNSHLLAIRPSREAFVPQFLYYVLTSQVFMDFIAVEKRGTTFDGLTQESMGRLPMPLPPLAAQRAIVDYLDRETSRIDALIAAKQRMVDLLEERFRVARINLVIDRDDPIRQDGPPWLGSIPRAWRFARLKFFAKMDSGHTPNKQVDAYWMDCTIPWITLNDVSNLEHAWRFFNPKNAVNELGLQNSSAHVLPADAVVMSRDATVGRSAILGRPMAVSQHFVAWICGTELFPEYLLNVIRGPMQHHFGSLTAGATIATIGMPDLNQLVIPLPLMGEQAKITKAIAEIEDIARTTISIVTEQITLLRERRKALITAAVTGQLGIGEAL